MKEAVRISKLFKDLYNGHPWIDVTIMGNLERISPEQAARRTLPNCNTIWEIVNHLICWRNNVMQRVQGKIMNAPATNYIEPVTDASDTAWQATLQKLEESQQQWINFLDELDEKKFDIIYPVNKLTWYEHILGILQHDAYHLGQIVLLAKQA